MRFTIIGMLFIGLVILACNKNARVNDHCETGCKPNRACTEEFRSLMIEVVNSSNAGVELDSFKVIRVRDNKTIVDNVEWQQPAGVSYRPGVYLLYSDAYKDETTVCGEDFVFEGYLDNLKVATRVYRIAHDCCHINRLAGDIKIVIGQ